MEVKKLFFWILFLNFLVCQTEAQQYAITSPDRNIGVNIDVGKTISYTVKYKDKILIGPSGISMSFQPDIFNGKVPVVSDTLTRFVKSKIIPVIKEKRRKALDPDKRIACKQGFLTHEKIRFAHLALFQGKGEAG